MRQKLIFLIIGIFVFFIGILLIPFTSANIDYVNKSHPSCNDANSQVTAQNPATPWCNITTTTLDKVTANNDVGIASGWYFLSSYATLRNKAGNITIYALPSQDVHLTNGLEEFYNGTVVWTNISTNGAGFALWLAPITSGKNCVYGYYNDTKRMLYPACIDYTVCAGSACTPGGGSPDDPWMNWTWFNTSSSTITVGLPYNSIWHNTSDNYVYYRTYNLSENPNGESFVIGDSSVASRNAIFRMYNLSNANGGVIFANLTMELSDIGFWLQNTASNVTFQNINFINGNQPILNDGAVGQHNNKTSVLNSTAQYLRKDNWTWAYEHDIGSEFYRVYRADDNQKILGNVINGYNNGVVSYRSAVPTTESYMIEVAYNLWSNITDDCYEFEPYANCARIHNDKCVDSHVVMTWNPSNSTTCPSIWNYSVGYATQSDSYAVGDMRVFKMGGDSVGDTGGWIVDHNTLSGEQIVDTTSTGSHQLTRVNFTNNIIITNNTATMIERTGTDADGNYWNNNLYYKFSTGAAWTYYNNDSDSTAYYNLTHLATSPNYKGTWDVNSVYENPLLDADYIPRYDSPACGAASDGTDIGALPCNDDLIEFNSETPTSGVSLSQRSIVASANITTNNLKNLAVKINGITYEIYNSSLLWLEFENNTMLGENDTYISDISSYNRTINRVGATINNSCANFDGRGDYLTASGLNINNQSSYLIMIDFSFLNKTNKPSSTVNGGLYNQRNGGPKNGTLLYLLKNTSGLRSPDRIYLDIYNDSFEQSLGYTTLYDGERYDTSISYNKTHYTLNLFNAIDSRQQASKYNNSGNFEIGTVWAASENYSMNGSICQFIVLNRSSQINEERNKYYLTKVSSNTYQFKTTRSGYSNEQINFSIIANNVETETRTIYLNTTIYVNATINYSISTKTINFSTGTQDSYGSRYILQPINLTMKQHYQNMSIDYYRIWIKNADEIPNTGTWLDMMPVSPPTNCLTYDYTNLTTMIKWTLDVGMTPHLMFVHVPPCWANYTSSGSVMPMPNASVSLDYFGNYTYNIFAYCKAQCSSGNWSCVGSQSFDNWVFQIGNEPGGGGDEGTFSDYTQKVYIPAINRIRQFGDNPKILTGTFQSLSHIVTFFSLINSSQQPTLGSFHPYDELDMADPDMSGFTGINIQDALRTSTKASYYTAPEQYYSFIKGINPSIEMVNDEYSLSSEYIPHKVRFINDSSGAVWMASSFYWQLQSHFLFENQFEGMGGDQFGFGILVRKNSSDFSSVRPLYDVRVKFADRFTSGKQMYVASSTDNMIELIGTNDNLMLVNKYNQTVQLDLSVDSKVLTLLTDGIVTYSPSNSVYSISINPFEVKFLDFESPSQLMVSQIFTVRNVLIVKGNSFSIRG